MPYRRLPNTDKARLRALEKSFKKFDSEGPKGVPYSDATLQLLRTFFPKFQSALLNLEAARKNQAFKNKEFTELHKKARMYVSHYIQIMNFAINRGELKSDIRKFYGIEDFDNNLPPLSTDLDLIEWGKKIIEGDQKRIMNGGNPFYNPSIAVVKVNFEKFTDAHHFQKNLQATSDRSSTLVNELREEADDLIVKIWNEIERNFDHLNDGLKRKEAEKFGVIYVLRKTERAKIKAQQNQSQLNF